MNGWFGGTGIFRKYKRITSGRLSDMISQLCKHALTEYPVGNHSSDPTCAEDETISEYVLLVREFEEWKKSRPTVNTQQAAARIVNGVSQQILIGTPQPLGEDGGAMRSQIAEENRARDTNSFPSTPSLDIHRNATILRLVGDAGVPDAAVPLVATGTQQVSSARSTTNQQHVSLT